MTKKFLLWLLLSEGMCAAYAQKGWQNMDPFYQPLPAGFHVYKSVDSVGGKPNIMYYAIADLDDRTLDFTSDTSFKRRLTPDQYFEKNDQPLLVVNCSFFSFATNQNLNIVMKDGRFTSYNEHSLAGRGKDTLTYLHPFTGALGISKRRKADIAWVYTDSARKFPYASQVPVKAFRDSVAATHLDDITRRNKEARFSKWKMQTAIGGGPVLLQDGAVKISNDEEHKFAGKAATNREPRTGIGYTKDHKLVIFVCEGRSDTAAGLTLFQMAGILKDLGCVEALNLDGGGSSCMLINGKETNTPSSKGEQRPVPSVFMIRHK